MLIWWEDQILRQPLNLTTKCDHTQSNWSLFSAQIFSSDGNSSDHLANKLYYKKMAYLKKTCLNHTQCYVSWKFRIRNKANISSSKQISNSSTYRYKYTYKVCIKLPWIILAPRTPHWIEKFHHSFMITFFSFILFPIWNVKDVNKVMHVAVCTMIAWLSQRRSENNHELSK